jgi:hypothetical protein
MDEYLFVYRPTKQINKRIRQNAELVYKWGYNDGNIECIYKLDQPILDTKNFKSWLENILYDDEGLGTVAKVFSKENFENFEYDIKHSTDISDLIDDKSISKIIKKESFGGDIRKYISTSSSKHKYLIRFGLFRTRSVRNKGFEPISMGSVSQFIEQDVCDKNKRSGVEASEYPTADRILKWSEKVNNRWDLNCKASGTISINGKNRSDINIWFNGFIIYDADENVKDWCDQRWDAVDSWSERDKLNDLYLYPHDYEIRYSDYENVPRTAIRMFWK